MTTLIDFEMEYIMRSLYILILLGFFVVVIQSRPSQPEDNDESQEELQYESDNGSSAGDTPDDSTFGDEDLTNQEAEQNRRLLDMNRNTYLQKNAADSGAPSNSDAPDHKLARDRDIRNDKVKEAVNSDDDFQTYGKRHQFSKYIESSDANDQSEMVQHLTNRDVNNYKNNHAHNNMIMDNPLDKRTIEAKKAPIEEGCLLFGNNREQMSKIDKKDSNSNEQLDLSQRSSYTKQYYNQMQSDNRATIDSDGRYNEYLYSNRDRREAKKSNQDNPISNVETGKEDLEKTDNESEEMAIRRHIKKMSSEELEQLLNSLSEEKRALLNKIIDDVDLSEKSSDSIQKREITKKAGAVEDNSDIEGSQSESSKVDGLSVVDVTTAFPATQNLKITQTDKQAESEPDSTELIIQKASQERNIENKADLNSNNDNNSEKSDVFLNSFASIGNSNKNEPDVVENNQVTSKKEIKRETNLKDGVDAISIQDPKMLESESHDDAGYLRPQDEDRSQFLDEVDQSGFYDNSKNYKRDVDKQSELDSQFKSLEESFPNSDAYDESAPYSGPLIRVKRKDTEPNKKRSVAVLPDENVGFFPYKAENEDDDNDEGSEFDDEGYYPAPNFASNENKNVNSNSQKTRRNDANCKLDNVDNASAGTISLGSDTDTVLSGVEGVDENLMFSSGMRNRRKTEGNCADHVDDNNINQSTQDKKGDEDNKGTSDSDLNIPTYQENESFGGFPRNYEGELGRYKRIRRVKQSHFSEDSSNT